MTAAATLPPVPRTPPTSSPRGSGSVSASSSPRAGAGGASSPFFAASTASSRARAASAARHRRSSSAFYEDFDEMGTLAAPIPLAGPSVRRPTSHSPRQSVSKTAASPRPSFSTASSVVSSPDPGLGPSKRRESSLWTTTTTGSSLHSGSDAGPSRRRGSSNFTGVSSETLPRESRDARRESSWTTTTSDSLSVGRPSFSRERPSSEISEGRLSVDEKTTPTRGERRLSGLGTSPKGPRAMRPPSQTSVTSSPASRPTVPPPLHSSTSSIPRASPRSTPKRTPSAVIPPLSPPDASPRSSPSASRRSSLNRTITSRRPGNSTPPKVQVYSSSPISPQRSRMGHQRKLTADTDFAPGLGIRNLGADTFGVGRLVGSRRTSYHLSNSSVSSNSAPSERSRSPASPVKEPGNDAQFDTGQARTMLAVPLDIPTTGSEEERDKVVDLGSAPVSRQPSQNFQSTPPPTSPVKDNRRHSTHSTRSFGSFDIPRRTSSASPQASPTISPRKSSLQSLLDDPPQPADMAPVPPRRASRAVLLGEVTARPSLLSRHSETSNTSKDSTVDHSTYTFPNGYFQSADAETHPAPLSEEEKEKQDIPHLSTDVPITSRLPRVDRKSPGLSISPPPPRGPLRSASQLPRPSPPIPAKSPLRSISRQTSGMSLISRAPTSRSASGVSVFGATTPPVNGSNRSEPPTPVEVLTTPSTPSEVPPRPKRASRSSLGGPSSPRSQVPFPSPAPSSATTAGGSTDRDEIRFTMLTTGSVYSQDSAPPSATVSAFGTDISTPLSAKEGVVTEEPEEDQEPVMVPSSPEIRRRPTRRHRLDAYGWGRRKEVPDLEAASVAGTEETVGRRSPRPRLHMPDKVLPTLPSATTPGGINDTPTSVRTINTLTSASSVSNRAMQSHENSPITPDDHSPVRSPSMPQLKLASGPSKAVKVLGLLPTSPKFARTASTPTTLLPSAQVTSPLTSPKVPRSPSMSKRSYLIREIATTERAYANDLALVRDAYLTRFPRPMSQHSVGTTGESPGYISDHSRRSSIYTYQTAETKRSSAHEASSTSLAAGTPGVPPKSPNVAGNGSANPSPVTTARSSAVMGPPIGKPLSPADLRAVFLNLEQLAGLAEELAVAFEKAIGDDRDSAPGKEGETGSDRLGEVFASLLPRLRPLYTHYCARQAIASNRLRDLLADPAHKAHLDDCWSRVKSRTHAWNLDSMLIKPVQRITKYPLLFDDLLSCTTPVHPDYFNIRLAASLAREVALEIDEAKRRKDVVAQVISPRKQPAANVPLLPNNKSAQKGKLKIFKRDKPPISMSASSSSLSLAKTLSSTGTDLAPPGEIAKADRQKLKELVDRVEACDVCVRRLGKEIIMWTAAAKEVLTAEEGLIGCFDRVVRLDPTDQPSIRLAAFKVALDEMMRDSWTPLDTEVRDSILPALSRLLEAHVNPRKVISRRQTRLGEYDRYVTLTRARKPVDRALIDCARECVALHYQLLEDLPTLLQGYMRIFDLIITAFAHAQARYHLSIQSKLEMFSRRWIDAPRRHSSGEPVEGIDLKSGRGIVKAWHAAWSPYAEAMEHFSCTRPAKQVASRLATFSERPGSRGHSRHNSSASVDRPSLRHSPSFGGTPISSRPPSPGKSGSQSRPRSISLIGQPPTVVVPEPLGGGRGGRFGLFRQNSARSIGKPNSRPSSPRPMSPPNGQATNGNRNRLSAHLEVNPNRLSFGLPKISPASSMGGFESLAMTSPQPSVTRPRPPSSLRYSDYGSYDNDHTLMPGHPFAGLGMAEGEGLGLGTADAMVRSPLNEARRVSEVSEASQASELSEASRLSDMSGLGALGGIESDAGEGWRNEPVIYQCACVADFDPSIVPSGRYRGLRFLPMMTGDLIDVFFEVGRIDELPSFPFTDVGVENDGVLVGRAEDGSIGLVICSFLEPLRE